jgi:hypothetical protein
MEHVSLKDVYRLFLLSCSFLFFFLPTRSATLPLSVPPPQPYILPLDHRLPTPWRVDLEKSSTSLGIKHIQVNKVSMHEKANQVSMSN